MTIQDCYRILGTPPTATDEEITRAFKKLAQRYHPDKNRDRVEWATRMMADLNVSYTTVMSHRFTQSSGEEAETTEQHEETDKARGETRHNQRPQEEREKNRQEEIRDIFERDLLIKRFVKYREISKDFLYKYFQYNLYNLARREASDNKRIFNNIVYHLRKTYHSILQLMALTRDEELLQHFSVFSGMLFHFYRASECLNILDSYSNIIDVEAYRLYKKGDEALHVSHKEIFYDRHNRGTLKKEVALPYLLKAEHDLRETVRRFPQSTWSVETRIKLEYVQALKRYFALFFTSGD